MKLYKDENYTIGRIHDTVIMINGEPHYVQHYDEWRYNVKRLSTGKSRLIDLRKTKVDLTPIPLGNIEVGNQDCFYLSRVPERRWKQGLTMESLSQRHPYEKDPMHLWLMGRDLFFTKGFTDMVNNKYRSIQEVLDVLEIRKILPIHRVFAIWRKTDKSYLLLYRGKTVGGIDKETLDIHLFEEYKYLNESIQEALNGDNA